jgi:bifunctional non-homologous end joining protein LigD
MRVNQGQEFVIGGYTLGPSCFDALIFGYYEKEKLIYVGRTRNGFTPSACAQLSKRFHDLHTAHVLSRTFPKRGVADGE